MLPHILGYVGRIVGVGRTEEGNPMAAYAVSGRSEMSKARKAVIEPSEEPRIVKIGPTGEETEEQRKSSDLIFYNAIIGYNGIFDILPKTPYLVVSNGAHTDGIIQRKQERKEVLLDDVLKEYGYEPDKLKTPRIAGALNIRFDKEEVFTSGLLAIVTEHGTGHYGHLSPPPGELYWISTYSGLSDENPEAPRFKELIDAVRHFRLPGKTAQELVDRFFEEIDERFIVCTAAAVYRNNGWEVAVKNKLEKQ